MADFLLQNPNLPEGEVTVCAVGAEYPELSDALRLQGVSAVELEPCKTLPAPVRSHADLLLVHLGGKKAVLSPHSGKNRDLLEKLGFETKVGERLPAAPYPHDAVYNAALFGRFCLANWKTLDPALQRAVEETGFQALSVRQGYARCSACILSETALITEDRGIAKAAERAGISALLVSPGAVSLPGYPCGFLGGCCGKLSKNLLAFTGAIEAHPDYENIRRFADGEGVSLLSLTDRPLFDVGGILPLRERLTSCTNQ
ncbi:MAG TPA: hypothetical protein IAB57_00190 [Candidatus Fimivivens faecavium]|nr:hypothetical protein [Candidatus Fimivivens faecavium]